MRSAACLLHALAAFLLAAPGIRNGPTGRHGRSRRSRRDRPLRLAVTLVLLASALSAGTVLAAASATMTVAGITGITPSGNAGPCSYQIDVAFDVAISGGTGWYNMGIDPASANASTVQIDGTGVSNPGTMTLFSPTPPWYFINAFLSDATVGSHTLFLKGGTSGVRWVASGSSPTIYAYLASDWTTTFTIPSCPAPPPTTMPTPVPTAASTPNPTLTRVKPTATTAAPVPTASPAPVTAAPTRTAPASPTQSPLPTPGATATEAPASRGTVSPTPSLGARSVTPVASQSDGVPPLVVGIVLGAVAITFGVARLGRRTSN